MNPGLFVSLFLLSMAFLGNLLGQNTPYRFKPGEEVYVLATSGMNVRAKANPDSPDIGKLLYGSKAKIANRGRNAYTLSDFGGYPVYDVWYEVNFNGNKGYVFGGYLSRFPPPKKDKTPYSSLDRYVQENFKLLASVPLFTREDQAENSCLWVEHYDKGISITRNNCPTTIGEYRYMFEHTDMTEVASLLKVLLSNAEYEFKVSYEADQQVIIFEQDLCIYKLRAVNALGVMVEMDCG